MGGQRAAALFTTLTIMIIIIIRTCVRRGKENIFISVRCILIISTIIMDRFPCVPNDNGVWTLQQPQQYHHGEGIEELKHLLFCATLELERARANAESQSQLQEAKLRHLQELLTVACRERDEAREQLLKLNHRLAEYSMLTNTQHHVTSRDRSSWLDTRLAVTEPIELNPSTTTTTTAAMHSNSSQLVGLGDQFRWNSVGHDFDFPHLDLRADVDLHQPQPQPQPQPPTSSSSKVHCSNLMELQEQPFYQQKEQQLSFVERQEPEVPEQQRRHQVESHRPLLVDDKSTDYDFWQQGAGIRQPLNQFLGIQEPSAHGHMTTYQNPKPDLLHTSPASILDPTSPTMPTHLPEPPESDLQFMLSALPERGKLLQAVVQAGPLLQTLLLAGPLPQWIYPPPALDTTEIPTISMSLSPNSLPLGPMVHHHVPSPNIPTSALDPLQANSSPGSSSHQSLSPCARINEHHTSFITSLQSTSAAASSSSKFLCTPMFNSQDSTGPPLKFAKIH